MMSPKIRIQGKLYSLNPTGEVQNPGFSASLGYVVTGSEKDSQAAFMVVSISGTTLSGWVKARTMSDDEARKRVNNIITLILPYVDFPLSV